MKEGFSEIGKKIYNDLAQSDNMFVQMGRSSYTHLEFSLAMNDIAKNLKFEKNDVLLDAGGGTGWTSIYFSPIVKEITLFDYAENAVDKAKEQTSYFNNISVFQDDILKMDNVRNKKYNKIIVGSVLQYMENEKQIYTIFQNIYDVLQKEGRVILTHNPDINMKQQHIQSYSRLNWDEERLYKALETEEQRYWLDEEVLKNICKEIGFTSYHISQINPKLFQSTHMFDFVVQK